MSTLKKKSIREEVWLRTCGENFSHPCITHWCSNRITVFDFHVAHNIPSSRGGTNTFENLKPMCARCNYAMGNRYTIDEWQRLMSVSNAGAPSLAPPETLQAETLQAETTQPEYDALPDETPNAQLHQESSEPM